MRHIWYLQRHNPYINRAIERSEKGKIPEDFEVKESTIEEVKGNGLFCKYDIKEGEILGEYLGEKVQVGSKRLSKHYRKGENNYMFVVLDPTRTRPAFYIDSSDPSKSSFPRYANGALKREQQNTAFAQFNDRIFLYAVKDISNGTELVADYGEQYHEVISPE